MKNILLRTSLFAGLLTALVACSDFGSSKAEAMVIPPTKISMTDQPGVPAGWVTDYKAALELAKKENRPVLIDFTGSDWCGWCIKLDRETFSKEAFKTYAKDNLVLLYLDFPNEKPQDAALKQQNVKLKGEYGVRGFPTMVLLSPDGKTIWQNGGYLAGGPDALISAINKATGK